MDLSSDRLSSIQDLFCQLPGQETLLQLYQVNILNFIEFIDLSAGFSFYIAKPRVVTFWSPELSKIFDNMLLAACLASFELIESLRHKFIYKYSIRKKDRRLYN